MNGRDRRIEERLEGIERALRLLARAVLSEASAIEEIEDTLAGSGAPDVVGGQVTVLKP